MCGGYTKPSNTVAVDGGKIVSVTKQDGIVKVVTLRPLTGRKDTFTLSTTAASALAQALQNA